MKLRFSLYPLIIVVLLTALTGCQRTIEFEGITISTTDTFHLNAPDLYFENYKTPSSKITWTIRDKQTVMDIIERMTPLPDKKHGDPDTIIMGGTPMTLRLENNKYTLEIVFRLQNLMVFIYRGKSNIRDITFYECSYEDYLTMLTFFYPAEFFEREREYYQ